MDICRNPHEYANLCAAQYIIELEKKQMEETITATEISRCATQSFNRAVSDIIRFAKTPEEYSKMLRIFESDIRKVDNVAHEREYEIAHEQLELMRAIADSADWKAILTE